MATARGVKSAVGTAGKTVGGFVGQKVNSFTSNYANRNTAGGRMIGKARKVFGASNLNGDNNE